MNKHVQIREISEKTHRKLKMRAAAEGLSMSDYVKRLIDRDLARPSWDDMVKRMRALEPVALSVSAADVIRRERDAR